MMVDQRGDPVPVDEVQTPADKGKTLGGEVLDGWRELHLAVEPWPDGMGVARRHLDRAVLQQRADVCRDDVMLDLRNLVGLVHDRPGAEDGEQADGGHGGELLDDAVPAAARGERHHGLAPLLAEHGAHPLRETGWRRLATLLSHLLRQGPQIGDVGVARLASCLVLGHQAGAIVRQLVVQPGARQILDLLTPHVCRSPWAVARAP